MAKLKPYFVEITGSTDPEVSANGRCGDFASQDQAERFASRFAASHLTAKVYRRTGRGGKVAELVAEYGGGRAA